MKSKILCFNFKVCEDSTEFSILPEPVQPKQNVTHAAAYSGHEQTHSPKLAGRQPKACHAILLSLHLLLHLQFASWSCWRENSKSP